MKFYTDYLWFNTKKHREYINISSEVADSVLNEYYDMIIARQYMLEGGLNFNDKAESIEVPIGWSARIFKDTHSRYLSII